MKKGATPQFAAAWWQSSQPKGVASARDLKSALDDYEKARAKLKGDGNEAALKAATKALKDVEAAVDAVIAEAGKLLKAPPKKGDFDAADAEETVKALKKYDAAYAGERAELAGMVEDEAEEDDGDFVEPEAFRAYLLKSLRKLRGGDPMNFGFAVGKKAPQHRLALHKSKGAKSLAALLTRETALHVTTCGIATAHPERTDTIMLAIEGKQLPGLKKKAERLLKAFKPLPFAHVGLLVDGAEVEDIADPDDTDTDDLDGPPAAPPIAALLTSTLTAMMRQIPPAANGDATVQAALVAAATAARTTLAGGNLAQAKDEIDALGRALAAALEKARANPERGKPNTDGAGVAVAKSMLLWDETRKYLLGQLQTLEQTIVELSAEESDFAEIKANVPVLEEVLEKLDTSLSQKLNQIHSVEDPAARAKLRAEAKGIVEGYQSYIASEPLMAELDRNPFGVKFDAVARVDTTLKAILERM